MNAIIRFFAPPVALLASSVALFAATVPEPSTVFYGKVLHRSNGVEHQLTEGTLTWALRDQKGVPFSFTVELESIKGVFSYQMRIPHQLSASGLSVDPAVVGLAAGEARYDFVSITVDGAPAQVIWSGSDFLNVLQKSRGGTHRIDLEVSHALADADGDGMPDWWEELYGLDEQVPDGGLDIDGDGLNNLAEFRGGTSPMHDDRKPSIQTLNVAAYGESDSGVWLRAVDVDTQPTNLAFTLARQPAGGSLLLGGAALQVGDKFSQAQLNEGLLIYRHTDRGVNQTNFAVALRDGTHPVVEAEIKVDIFPSSPVQLKTALVAGNPSWWRNENAIFEAYWGLRENVLSGELVKSSLLYLLGKDYDWTLWDERSRTLPVTLAVAGQGSNFLLGGAADDVLTGSAQDDILAGGAGIDRLRGGGGMDLFIVSDPGLEIIEDFNISDDILDLNDLVLGSVGLLDAFLKASNNGTDTEIRVDRNGDGSGFGDAVIQLKGLALVQDDLHSLWSRGQLLLGKVQGKPSVTIEGWPSQALEEGFTLATLTVRRNGPVEQPLTVGISATGSATNGVDYKALPTTLSFAAGQNTASLSVEPLLDGTSEYIEQLNLGLIGGLGYVLGATASGRIDIVDAKQRFNLQALQTVAVVNDAPAYLIIQRVGPKTGVVQLLLTVSGSGVKNVDYTAIPTLVTFADNQSSLFLPVEAMAGGVLAGSETSRTVKVALKPAFGDEYLLGSATSATVRLLSSIGDFDAWAAEVLPDADPSVNLAEVTSPRTGMSALLEYASSYGLRLNDGVDAKERGLLTPRMQRDATGVIFEFNKRLDDPGLEYVIERSADMITWQSGPGLFEEVPLSAAEENAGRVRYRVVNPESAKIFMRIRVKLNK